jgi:hypothetical protein
MLLLKDLSVVLSVLLGELLRRVEHHHASFAKGEITRTILKKIARFVPLVDIVLKIKALVWIAKSVHIIVEKCLLLAFLVSPEGFLTVVDQLVVLYVLSENTSILLDLWDALIVSLVHMALPEVSRFVIFVVLEATKTNMLNYPVRFVKRVVHHLLIRQRNVQSVYQDYIQVTKDLWPVMFALLVHFSDRLERHRV